MKRNPPKSKSLPLRLSAAVSLLSVQAAAALSAIPIINADSSATFTLRAPEARSVKLRCEGVRGGDMTRGAGGVWTFTTAPLAPDIYDYSFIVDGVRITDPDNPHLKYNLRNNSSELIVPSPAGTPPQIWEADDVPRGTLHRHTFRSKISGDDRDFIVYTPPGYGAAGASAGVGVGAGAGAGAGAGRRYPVLYLLHGYTDDATAWSTVGRANTILDNLIAAGRARPMIVVMPLGYGTMDVVRADRKRAPLRDGLWERSISLFKTMLLDEVMPRVEAEYRVSAKREDRAIAGLSMGGTQSLDIGLNNPDRFAWIGAFSSGGLPGDFDKAYPNFNAENSKGIRLIWLACGVEDGLLVANNKIAKWISDRKASEVCDIYKVTDFGHSFRNWRRYFAEFAPLLFQNRE